MKIAPKGASFVRSPSSNEIFFHDIPPERAEQIIRASNVNVVYHVLSRRDAKSMG